MTQKLGVIVHLFSVINGWSFNRKIKVQIQKNSRVDLHLLKIL